MKTMASRSYTACLLWVAFLFVPALVHASDDGDCQMGCINQFADDFNNCVFEYDPVACINFALYRESLCQLDCLFLDTSLTPPGDHYTRPGKDRHPAFVPARLAATFGGGSCRQEEAPWRRASPGERAKLPGFRLSAVLGDGAPKG